MGSPVDGDGDDDAAVVAFLARHAPYDRLTPAERQRAAREASVWTAGDGDVLLQPSDGPVSGLHIVSRGQVHGERPDADAPFVLEPGECFPLAALLGERATRTVYRAHGATAGLRLPPALFRDLFTANAGFRDFCLRGVSSLLDAVGRAVQSEAVHSVGAGSTFDTPLAAIMRTEPVVADGGVAVAAAVERMHERRVGSIVVTDGHGHPQGIFTLHDLRALIASGGDLQTPLSAAMTPEPRTLDADAAAFEAVVAMAGAGIRHLPLVRDGVLVGVVSERDLFALQRIDVVQLIRAIDAAGDVDALVASRAGVTGLIDALMAHGADAGHITRVLTLLNDHTVARAVALCVAEEAQTPPAFTWLAFGSEGRGEQTLVTDQDNGILFDATAADTGAAREALLPLARRINDALARCGFTLCKGNIMAGNPELCLSRTEWRDRFATIIRSNTPENLLRSSIYFDFRAVHGDAAPAEALRGEVLERTAGQSLFRRMMAGNALQHRPPLGLLRDFVTERDAAGADTLDLKIRGLTPFVDAARLLALEGGLSPTNTTERLQAVGEAGLMQSDAVAAWTTSFAFLQMLRLRLHQSQARAGEVMSNHLDPDGLNAMDRRVLKEAFRQARDLQKRLAIRYQL